jgi:hypothetical protein
MVENEIQFLSWKEFRQMAPSILRLEITRLGELIDAAPPDALDVRNALVKARFEVQRFVACLENAEKESVDACASHLQTALLALSFDEQALDPASRQTCAYILDRLTYVLNRIALVY